LTPCGLVGLGRATSSGRCVGRCPSLAQHQHPFAFVPSCSSVRPARLPSTTFAEGSTGLSDPAGPARLVLSGPSHRVATGTGLTKAPLLRFGPLQRSPAAPALSGVADIRTIPLRRSSPVNPIALFRRPIFRSSVRRVDLRVPWTSSLRFYARARGDAASRLVLSRARVRLGSCTAADFFARCSATQPDDSAAWPGPRLSPTVPAALMGFRPSQYSSRPRVSARLHAATCPPTVSRPPAARSFSPGPGSHARPSCLGHSPTLRSLICRAPPAACVRRGSWAFSSRASRTTPSGSSLLRIAGVAVTALGFSSSLRSSGTGRHGTRVTRAV
jgi:hypothetical protein